jgi:nucleoside-diphosphate-sugar epimerase
VDTVVHLAALAHQSDPRHQPDEAAFMAVNAKGTKRLAEAVVGRMTVHHFVFVSSIGAVAESGDAVVDEHTQPGPDSLYGRSKLAAEQALKVAFDGSSIEWCVLRPVLVYGPGNPGNMARLLRLVTIGMPLPLGVTRFPDSSVVL